MISRLVVASKNPDKVVEIESILLEAGVVGEVMRGLDWADVVEDGETLEANALLKARAVHAATGVACVADDTGLEVDALGGAPGVHTARFAGPQATYAENVEALLSALSGVTDRAARFRTVVAFVDGTTAITAEGVLEGSIGHERRGEGGFGYDPVFVVGTSTLAEMPAEAKNRMSHRARAILALADHLEGV